VIKAVQKERLRKLTGLLLVAIIISGCLTTEVQSLFSIPAQQRLTVGDRINFTSSFPRHVLDNLQLYVDQNESNVLKLNNGVPVAFGPGKANLKLKLFGLIPIKNMEVQVVPQVKLIPGGQSIGVLLHAEGVMVVGQSIVQDINGNKYNPAKEAGIQNGDVILKLNGQRVNSDDQVAKIVNNAGQKGQDVKLTIKRKNKFLNKSVKPILCKETRRFRIGLYIRDSAAGVGTLTFYDPVTEKYGALGHIITDADTNQPIDVSDGKIVRSSVQGIQASRKGAPGEKIGMFIDDRNFIGNIEKNTKLGIYGRIISNSATGIQTQQALPIALANQIEEGEAKILTVLEGEKIEEFDIQIKKVLPQKEPDSKGLIIEITDPRLLKKTGGIIQGMSGSPIVQNGKIVGAVTHVFINDPTRGYGCLIEWMLNEAGYSQEPLRKAG
jgi:stage IV sporulation protein B